MSEYIGVVDLDTSNLPQSSQQPMGMQQRPVILVLNCTTCCDILGVGIQLSYRNTTGAPGGVIEAVGGALQVEIAR